LGPRTYLPLSPSPRARAAYHVSTLLYALVQAFIKSVNMEIIFNFRFGTGKDENLIVNFTEFVDSKVYSDGRSSN
jgi:hypothetical protein